MSMNDIAMLFQFVGGLGMFLYGMNIMADGLQKSAGNKMKKLLGYLTNNKVLAIIVGALVTAIIQSSSATTVMVVGFVNAGIISLTQAVGVIMGANIGTTMTAWIVSMSEWGGMLKPEFFAPLLIGIGAFIMLFAKKEKKREIGEILVGFGILFIGLSFMSGAIEPYKDAPIFAQAFAFLGSNPFLGILAGAVVTAVIQSSSASLGILQTLAMNGVVTWNSAVFIALGQNIGTCVTALLSSMGTHKTAKRAAVIHLLFNVIGAVFFGVVMWVVFLINKNLGTANIDSVQLSIFHTCFNICNTILLFPFSSWLVKMSHLIIKGDEVSEEEADAVISLPHLDERILNSPSFAIESVVGEVDRMGKLVKDQLQVSVDALLEQDQEKVERAYRMERTTNLFEKAITEYLIKISYESLTAEQNELVSNLFYTVSDIERMGDHCENLAESAENMIKNHMSFSPKATAGLKQMTELTGRAVEYAVSARKQDSVELAVQAIQLEEEVDILEDELREGHVERMTNKECSAEQGIVFSEVISNIERVADHADNVAGYVIDENRNRRLGIRQKAEVN